MSRLHITLLQTYQKNAHSCVAYFAPATNTAANDLPLSLPPSLSLTHTHARTHAHKHAHTHKDTHVQRCAPQPWEERLAQTK